MPRRVRDFIEISEYTSLDTLIRYLQTVRESLPPGAEPELRLRGDEIFGQRLTISFMRELTQEESQLEAKYAGNDDPPADPVIERLRAELDKVEFDDQAHGI